MHVRLHVGCNRLLWGDCCFCTGFFLVADAADVLVFGCRKLSVDIAPKRPLGTERPWQMYRAPHECYILRTGFIMALKPDILRTLPNIKKNNTNL